MVPVTFTVSSALDAGTGSFRQAIIDANNVAGPDIIVFNVPGGTLSPTLANGPYPAITGQVTIDGTTQPGTNRVELVGTALAAAGGDGLVFATGSAGSVVQGLAINRFAGAGIRLNTGASGITVVNNYIGTDTAATGPQPNATAGIFISSSGNTIGGATAGSRNIISGNTGSGITFFSPGASNNVVLNNYIGTDITGNRPLPNVGFGVIINAAGSNTIGGTTAAARNIISANAAGGIQIRGTTATNNVVQGNNIGTDSTGSNDQGNTNDGVLIIDDASNNTVGGAGGVGGNNIAFNGGLNTLFSGVAVANGSVASGNVPAGPGNAILSNNIFTNGGLGIDLGLTDIQLNDTLDPDTGPNQLQNYPMLFQASSVTGTGITRIQGTLNSIASTTYTIQFFDNTQAPDPSGFGEGELFIGQTTVTTNAAGNGAFDVTLPRPTFFNNFITATATDPAGNTSEFSQARQVLNSFLNFVDLGVTLSAAPNPVQAGSILTYTATVTNNGFATANNVTLIDVLPPGVVFVGATPNTFTQNGSTLTFDLGTLAINQSATVTIDVRPAVNGTISNRASVSAAVFDPFPGNNSAAVDTQVILPPGTSVLAFMLDRFNVGEGDNAATVTVSRTNSLVGTVSIDFATTNGTAGDGTGGSDNDYQASTGTLVFADGEETKTFFVPIFEDGGPLGIEGNETIGLTLSNPQGTAILGVPNTSLLTIFDNDPPPSPIQFLQFSQPPTFSAIESSLAATITVTRTGGTTGTVSVDFAASDATAVQNIDYLPTSGTVRFDDGVLTQPIVIPLIDNTLLDGNRTFNLTLSNATGAVLAPPTQAVVTIVDDESPTAGFFQFSSPTYAVGEGGGQATITVTRIGGTGASSINFGTAPGGSATPDVDYLQTAGILSFAPGETSQSFTVTILNDALVEGDETVFLNLTPIGDAVLLNPSAATLTILDDEVPPAGTLQFDAASYSVLEGGGATITVVRTGGRTGTVTVRLATSGGSATPGADYTAVDSILTFADGQASQTVIIPTIDDSQIEAAETFDLVLISPTGGANLGSPASASVTIVENDFDRTPPFVTDVQFVGAAQGGIGGFILTFSEPLDPARATNPANYRVASAGRDGQLGTGDDVGLPLASLQYVPGSVTVTVTLARSVIRNQFFQLVVNGTPPAGITDLAGNFLLGGDFVTAIGQSFLRYVDDDGDIVTLRLRGGGVLNLFRAAANEARTLEVIGRRPGSSVLTGSVRRARGGDGRAGLQRTRGLGNFGEVRSRLRTPPFIVADLPTVTIRALDALLATGDEGLMIRRRRS